MSCRRQESNPNPVMQMVSSASLPAIHQHFPRNRPHYFFLYHSASCLAADSDRSGVTIPPNRCSSIAESLLCRAKCHTFVGNFAVVRMPRTTQRCLRHEGSSLDSSSYLKSTSHVSNNGSLVLKGLRIIRVLTSNTAKGICFR